MKFLSHKVSKPKFLHQSQTKVSELKFLNPRLLISKFQTTVPKLKFPSQSFQAKASKLDFPAKAFRPKFPSQRSQDKVLS